MDDWTFEEDEEQLREDLDIQRVILRSFGDVGDHFHELKKQEAQAEVSRLENLLEATRRKKDNGTDTPNEALTQSAHNSLQPTTPKKTSTTDADMKTPIKQYRLPSGSPSSLPSRKRSNNSWADQRPVKTHRATPPRQVSGDQPPSARSVRSVITQGTDEDPIDLTGSDVEIDSKWLGDEPKHEVLKGTAVGRNVSPSTLNPARQAHAAGGSEATAAQRDPKRTGPQSSLVPGLSTQHYKHYIKTEPLTPYAYPRYPTISTPTSEDRSFNGRRSLSSPQIREMVRTNSDSKNKDVPSWNSDGAHHGSVPHTPDFAAVRQPSSASGSRMPGSWDASWNHPPVVIKRDGTIRPASSLPKRYPNRDETGTLSDVIYNTSGFSHSPFMFGDGTAEADVDDHFARARHATRIDVEEARPAVSAEDIENLMRNIQPDLAKSDKILGETPAGLNTQLLPHQVEALAWMRRLEDGTNKGGILADDMGLGKTISVIALLLARRPTSSRRKTNLVVGPLSLLHQWKEELRTKVRGSHRLSVFVYHKSRATTEDLLNYDVVLTTYSTLAAEWKRLHQFQENNEGRQIDYSAGGMSRRFALLHPDRAKFYRVILDEAQFAKNANSQTAKGCHQLQAEFRWCLSGTPIMNDVSELFSLLAFLRIKPYNDWDNFRLAFGRLFGKRGDPKHQAMNKLRALLTAVMLRRKKNSTINGKPIIILPDKHEEELHVSMSGEERKFYSDLEAEARVKMNKYLRDGSVGKFYHVILVKILRMRQACCHPHLNIDVDDTLRSSNKDMQKLAKKLKDAVIENIKLDGHARQCTVCSDAGASPAFIHPCGHAGCGPCLQQLVEEAEQQGIQAGSEGSSKANCPAFPTCKVTFDASDLFDLRSFKVVHMPDTISDKEEHSDDDSDSVSGTDDEEARLNDMLPGEVDSRGNLKGFVVPDDIDGDEDDQDENGKLEERKSEETTDKKRQLNMIKQFEAEEREFERKKREARRRHQLRLDKIKPSMLRELRREANNNPRAHERYMAYLRKTWKTSSKVEACVNLLKQITTETDEKVIVFSQWTLLLDLLEVAMSLDSDLSAPERYDGSISHDLRDVAVQKLRSDKNVRVMLVGLRAGNAGLNLTAASRVIIMDPFWNPYTEMQAIDRTYRLGQKRKVKVYRILTTETIEDRIVALQQKKREMVDAALHEKNFKAMKGLSQADLRNLLMP